MGGVRCRPRLRRSGEVFFEEFFIFDNTKHGIKIFGNGCNGFGQSSGPSAFGGRLIRFLTRWDARAVDSIRLMLIFGRQTNSEILLLISYSARIGNRKATNRYRRFPVLRLSGCFFQFLYWPNFFFLPRHKWYKFDLSFVSNINRINISLCREGLDKSTVFGSPIGMGKLVLRGSFCLLTHFSELVCFDKMKWDGFKSFAF